MKVECCYCGDSCLYDNEQGECWGKVNTIDEVPGEDGDYYWIHTCEGHKDVYHGGKYKIEP